MISRGEVALITATIGLQAGLIHQSLFSIVILISFITTLITPLLLKLLYLFQPPGPTSSALEPLQEAVEQIVHPEGALHIQEEHHVR